MSRFGLFLEMNVTMEHPHEVRDTNGTTYVLGACLGKGGQGAVFQVRYQPLAVKLVYANSASMARQLEERIAQVRLLPLDGLNVARPLRLLARPQVGYVMELMTDMQSFSTLSIPKPTSDGDFSEWYLETGSLARRLRCLANAAGLIASVHERGITFGDISPNNVFISQHLEQSVTWLIDSDNLSYGGGHRALCTPGYGAPELYRGHGADTLSDAWSFAVLVFETLCILHPFVGDEVHDGDPALEEKAHRSELCWVDDPSGVNASSRGLPRDLVLSSGLSALMQACFEHSRTTREMRPGIASWAEKLRSAAAQVLHCVNCGSTHYLNRAHCPWCEEPRGAFLSCTSYLRDPSLQDPQRNPFMLVCAEPGHPKPLQRAAVTSGHSIDLGPELLGDQLEDTPLTLRLEGTALTISATEGHPYQLYHAERGPLEVAKFSRTIILESGDTHWWLIPESPAGLHRAVRLTFYPKEAR